MFLPDKRHASEEEIKDGRETGAVIVSARAIYHYHRCHHHYLRHFRLHQFHSSHLLRSSSSFLLRSHELFFPTKTLLFHSLSFSPSHFLLLFFLRLLPLPRFRFPRHRFLLRPNRPSVRRFPVRFLLPASGRSKSRE